MSQIWAISLKELKTYFVSPIAYVVTAMFLLVAGYFFYLILFMTKDANMMRYLFGNMSVVLLLISPLISMRLFSEEQRMHTLELLMTSPITDAGLVVGKFIASAGLLLAMLTITLYFPAILLYIGKPDILPMVTGYVGLFLMGCTFLAIGMLTSSWTENQIVSAVSAFAVSLILWFLGASNTAVSPTLGAVLNYLSLNSHFESFSKGLLTTSDVIYYLSIITVLLFITIRSLETRRWR